MAEHTRIGRGARSARAVAVALGIAGGLLAAELLMRALLFSTLEPFVRLGRHLRDPHHFGHAQRDDLYWILSHRWLTRSPDLAPGAHARYGWRSERFEPDSLAHRLEPVLGDRTPILLFGDSFTYCLTSAADCFQGQISHLPIGREASVLNYGVGGFGVDQILLLAGDVLERWDALAAADPDRPRPIVVVAVYVEDDLDRAALGFRSHVKPRFELVGDDLQLELPESLSTRAVLAERGLGVTSWLARYAIHGTRLGRGVVEREAERHRARLRTLTERLVAGHVAACEARGLEHFFLLLPGRPSLEVERWNWQEPLLEELLTRAGAAFVNARQDFERDMAASQRGPSAYFGSLEGPLVGHYDALGNAVASAALLRGLAGEDDGGQPSNPGALALAARRSLALARDPAVGAKGEGSGD